MAKGSLIFGAALLAMSGCTTTPVAPASAVPVVAERITYQAPHGADAKLEIVRDQGVLGSACFFAVFLNRAIVARMAPGERISLPVRSGEHILGVGRDRDARGLCGPDFDQNVVYRETVLAPGQVKAFRVILLGSGGADIQRSDF